MWWHVSVFQPFLSANNDLSYGYTHLVYPFIYWMFRVLLLFGCCDP